MSIDIIKELNNMVRHKNETFSLIAKTILSYSCFEDIRIKQIEDDCHVSSATIFRFCKEIKVSGFSELKFLLNSVEKRNYEIKIRDNYSLSKNTNEHLNNIALSFINTRDLLSDDVLNGVIDLIDQSRNIILFGVGSTYLVCRDLELKLDRIKKMAKSYQDANLQYFAAKNADESTLCIGVTYSGKTESVLRSLSIGKVNGAKTILITSEENQHLAIEVDYILYVCSTDSRYRLVTTASRFAMLYLVDLIYYSYASKNLESVNQILDKNRMYDKGM